MHNLLIEMAVNSASAQAVSDQLASTGGESLSVVWWIGAGLLVVGVAIGVIAYLRRRNAPAGSSEPVDGGE